MIAHRIKLSSDSLNLRVDVDDNGRIAIATIAGGGTSLRAGHHVPALELQSVDQSYARLRLLSLRTLERRGDCVGVTGDRFGSSWSLTHAPSQKEQR